MAGKGFLITMIGVPAVAICLGGGYLYTTMNNSQEQSHTESSKKSSEKSTSTHESSKSVKSESSSVSSSTSESSSERSSTSESSIESKTKSATSDSSSQTSVVSSSFDSELQNIAAQLGQTATKRDISTYADLPGRLPDLTILAPGVASQGNGHIGVVEVWSFADNTNPSIAYLYYFAEDGNAYVISYPRSRDDFNDFKETQNTEIENAWKQALQ